MAWLAEWSAMRDSSTPILSWLVAAGLLLLPAVAAARTLTLAVQRLSDAHVRARALRLVVDERGDAGALQLSAEHIEIPALALTGRLDGACTLQSAASGVRACTGPVRLHADDGSERVADIDVRLSDQRADIALTHEQSRVALSLPFASAAPIGASLRRVPWTWLEAPLAGAWRNGELRSGTFDGDATLQRDGAVEATYAADGLAFNTSDGTVSGERLQAQGRLQWQPSAAAAPLQVAATFRGGVLRAGAARIELPDTPIEAELAAQASAAGAWNITRFSWNDPEAAVLEADGEFQPGALAPLRRLAVRVQSAHFPLAARRYAGSLLAAQGLDALVLKGELSGQIAIDDRGMQALALATDAFDFGDAAGRFSFKGLRGGLDWASQGERPPTRLAWSSAHIAGRPFAGTAARWQSRQGALHLLGSLQTRLLGSSLSLRQTIVHPFAAGDDERLSSAFSVRGIGYDGDEGRLAAANVAADGELRLSASADEPHLRLDATFHGGEALAGPVYVKLPPTPVVVALDLRLGATRWQIQRFDWRDAGTLDVSAQGEIAPADEQPVKSLRLDVREAKLQPALERYARSWLATKGFGELQAQGAATGSLDFGADGLRRFAFDAHDVVVRDGAGRFAFNGVEGGVVWDFGGDTSPTTLAWRSMELFQIPFGAMRAQLESRRRAIVLSAPLAVDVLGGQLRLEKLSLLPRSPRGERYAASFAIAGIEMAQLSTVLGWPRFGGNLSGGIPEVELVGDRIELRGGLDLYVFDGHVGVSGVTLERPFGVAPSLGADIHFENLDLDQVTSAFSFGGMTGRLLGTISGLRLVDWSPVAFDAWLRTAGGGRMSYKAVDDITSIGGGGGLSSSLQTMALKVFDTFGYHRLGIRCRLRDDVCLMGGIDPLPADGATDAGAAGYTIVDGSGLPRITIVGHRRRVDWPTLVRRLVDATQGQGPVIR
jgi:hypothetical protein